MSENSPDPFCSRKNGPLRNRQIFKLTAFGGTFLATLPIFAIITNSYTIKLKCCFRAYDVGCRTGNYVRVELLALDMTKRAKAPEHK